MHTITITMIIGILLNYKYNEYNYYIDNTVLYVFLLLSCYNDIVYCNDIIYYLSKRKKLNLQIETQ